MAQRAAEPLVAEERRLLGVLPDSLVADQTGRSWTLVRRLRQNAGIEPARRSRKTLELDSEVYQLLGVRNRTTAELVSDIGANERQIRRSLNRLGAYRVGDCWRMK